jgi:hypothetical protein
MVLALFRPVAASHVVEAQRVFAAVDAATFAFAFSRSAASTFSASRRVLALVLPKKR